MLVENYSNSHQVQSVAVLVIFIRPSGQLLERCARFALFICYAYKFSLSTIGIAALTSPRTNLSPFTKGCRDRGALMRLINFWRDLFPTNRIIRTVAVTHSTCS